ncbi:sugar ABC transporter permease [Actinobacteria bacterium YIM 96077]|uniref:Sugar ABC transporter permease n=1 Tax=Phytoactinopolyspora halophila TaxID=1981511 RepID=A0A329QE62_9ACTN|nr:sugar ABC transporter permease [Phytoactinopolyspora halophila]AYY14040.1 sugar ABC transporter permease [Actinobacteria bacterium YIM 96077]RAW10291.1 sugar ABC transporter permease [Phytoactinopolyspora halophila]
MKTPQAERERSLPDSRLPHRKRALRTKSDSDTLPRPGAAYLLPAVIFFGVFAVVPLALVVVLSFSSWPGFGEIQWTGLDNWERLLGDSRVWESTRITLMLTALGWLTQTPMALLIGVWAAGPQRNRAVLSSIFFLPLLLSSAAIAVLFHRFLDPNYGMARELGPLFGLPDGNIIGSSQGAFITIVFVSGWQWIPFHTLLYQAGARNIPTVLYDAATIDGASRSAMFWRITVPQLRHTIVTSSVIMVVGSLITFETVLLLTGGGPGGATRILPYLMYTAGFESFEMGYAAAIATVLVVVATTMSLIIVKFSGFAKMRSTLEGM